MTVQTFKEQMKLITETFGMAEYSQSRQEAIWTECKDLPDASFAKIVKHFIWTKSVKYPPLPTHFFEEAHAQRKLLRERSEPQRQQEPVKEPENPAEVLKRVLEKMGATSIQDAMNKNRGRHEQTSD